MAKMKSLLLTFLCLLASPTMAYDIWDNPGGGVIRHEKIIEKVDSISEKVRILGFCESACTMYLSAKDVCVSPEAQLGFHEAYLDYGFYQVRSIPGDVFLSEHYNKKLKIQFWTWVTTGAFGDKNQPLYKSGQEMHDEFGYSLCP